MIRNDKKYIFKTMQNMRIAINFVKPRVTIPSRNLDFSLKEP